MNNAYVELQLTVCFCGKRKGVGKSFCWKCWRKLPARMKRALYELVGYPEAVAEAKKFLISRISPKEAL